MASSNSHHYTTVTITTPPLVLSKSLLAVTKRRIISKPSPVATQAKRKSTCKASKGIWWNMDRYHCLKVPRKKGEIQIGSIIGRLDDMNVLNTGKVHTFARYRRRSQASPNIPRHIETLAPGHVRTHCYKVCAELTIELLDITADECLTLIDASPRAEAYLWEHEYHQPVYIVTGLQLACASESEHSTHTVVELVDGKETSRAKTEIDGKVYAVRLIKICPSSILPTPHPNAPLTFRIMSDRNEKSSPPSYSELENIAWPGTSRSIANCASPPSYSEAQTLTQTPPPEQGRQTGKCNCPPSDSRRPCPANTPAKQYHAIEPMSPDKIWIGAVIGGRQGLKVLNKKHIVQAVTGLEMLASGLSTLESTTHRQVNRGGRWKGRWDWFWSSRRETRMTSTAPVEFVVCNQNSGNGIPIRWGLAGLWAEKSEGECSSPSRKGGSGRQSEFPFGCDAETWFLFRR
ncbi:hypothetical protein A9K55_009131 [Cordyceps militaris]|uniref:Uncharacterized protein n=1 Tax=Cordyceps militaris TaxID=73501 RepID=A0A2H4SJL4_CORMI|nr:hypothetical protein A9K55_009131 [Cordyceps militaris]